MSARKLLLCSCYAALCGLVVRACLQCPSWLRAQEELKVAPGPAMKIFANLEMELDRLGLAPYRAADRGRGGLSARSVERWND